MNHEERNRKQREYRARRGKRAYHMWKKWGGTKELYEERYREQGGCCAVCGIPVASRFDESGEYPGVFDHDHETLTPRGILCTPCNVALGYYEARIRKHKREFRDYLRRYTK